MTLVGASAAAWLVLPEAFPALRQRPAADASTALAGSSAGRPADSAAARTGANPAVPAAVAGARAPRFDVARIGARGTLVTAGQAEPGAEVTLSEGGRELGRARADARGEWVILPTDPLAPGVRELALTARLAGQDPVRGAETVLLLVPDRSAGPGSPASPDGQRDDGQRSPAMPLGPMAVLLPPAAAADAPLLLQAPPRPAGRARLSVDVVDYDDAGAMRFAGSAPPGSTVRLYAGRSLLGDAATDSAGRWNLTPDTQPGPGRQTLRADQLTATGVVTARVEVPFQRDQVAPELLRDGRVVVQPGHSLWRLSRLVYGRGVRYTVIYEANREQIRDPSRIYPGQIFAVPTGGV